ncbi:hypothetical protein EJ04DRAFT_190722 [Polyplosphaeria fusca]|uniref:Uncharacterized protein n=1 Tax=Polyplosphaeria fusca TaxID=682080 RepID=A0A9P4R384_9PLEO|nr:hypothetical protein EJ04DRAFT_190722 [Polyplosphaeria fusca]
MGRSSGPAVLTTHRNLPSTLYGPVQSGGTEDGKTLCAGRPLNFVSSSVPWWLACIPEPPPTPPASPRRRYPPLAAAVPAERACSTRRFNGSRASPPPPSISLPSHDSREPDRRFPSFALAPSSFDDGGRVDIRQGHANRNFRRLSEPSAVASAALTRPSYPQLFDFRLASL